MWSGTDKTVIVRGLAPLFFGGCLCESGPVRELASHPHPNTVLDERRADWLLPISALCLLYTPGGALEQAQAGYTIFLNSI